MAGRPSFGLPSRRLGRTSLDVTLVGVGTSTIGLPALYDNQMTFEEGVAVAMAILDGPFNFVDTSNGYGDSERQLGEAMRRRGGLPDGFVLASKVDPASGSSDFTGERVTRSAAESLERLGVDHVDLLHLHDPERVPFEEATRSGGAVEALQRLKADGVARHIGVAGYDIDLLRRYLDIDVFDVVLTHNRFTLLDQSAVPLLDDAATRGIAVLNAAPYGGGILAKGPDEVPRYCYAPADALTISRARTLAQICADAAVPLAAAALQFSMRDERVTSTVVGVSKPGRVAETLRLATVPIADDVWEAIRRATTAEPQP